MEITFTYYAPFELYGNDDELREISSTYRGAESIWIYVNQDDGRNPQYMSEGDLPAPQNTDKYRAVLLQASNPNHVVLMDVLANSKGHNHLEMTTEYLNELGDIPEAPDFQFSHTMYKYPSASMTYELTESMVTEDDEVIMFFKQNTLSWDMLNMNLYNLITEAEDKLEDPMVLDIPAIKDRYTRYIAILKYVLVELQEENVSPFKINIPQINKV